ncbi:MAG: hypothetical protein RJB66_1806 [Pseudomonadota bacterium]|jgi:hypothetical protein
MEKLRSTNTKKMTRTALIAFLFIGTACGQNYKASDRSLNPTASDQSQDYIYPTQTPTPTTTPQPTATATATPTPSATPTPNPTPGGSNNPPPSSSPLMSSLQYAKGSLSLTQSQSIETKNLIFVMQADGNLVLYRKSNQQPLWASNTTTRCVVKPCWVQFQGDGNLVIYQNDGKAIAASHTVGANKFELTDEAPHLRILGGPYDFLWWSRP